MRAEFRSAPGVCLTVEQAARLFDIEAMACDRILARLVATDELRRTEDGRYLHRDAPLDHPALKPVS